MFQIGDWRLQISEQILPLCANLILQRLTCFGDRREVVEMIERPAGIDDRFGAEGSVVGICDVHGIILRPHAALDDIDACGRVRTSRDGPHHFLQVGRIDVLVGNHRVTRHICADPALIQDVARLPGMARVSLFDRNDIEHAGAANLVRPHALDIRYA